MQPIIGALPDICNCFLQGFVKVAVQTGASLVPVRVPCWVQSLLFPGA